MSDHTTKAHSDYGGSVIGRVIACPASVSLCKTVPPRASSAYAEEGTAAHAVAEKLLRAGMWDAQQAIGDKTENGFTVTEDMAIAIQVYLDVVQEELASSSGAVMEIEQRFTLPVSTAAPGEVFGANDALVYHPSTGRLVVFDYKHGQGVSVSAEENSQLKFYAAGAALAHADWKISEVELVIVQPRARDAEGQDTPGVKRWAMPATDIIEFVSEIEGAVVRAKALQPEANAGPHCRWCAAVAVCPAKERDVIRGVGLAFDSVVGIDPTALPKPADMDVKRLSQILKGRAEFTAWLDGAADFAFNLLRQGIPVDGFKLVDKMARRKWTVAEDEVAAHLELTHGVSRDEVYPRQLVTITEAERLIKARIADKAERRSALDDLSLRFTIKDSSGQTIVSDTDRRDAVPAGPAVAFAGVSL